MTEKEYLVALYSFLPFGPVRTKLLVNYFGNSKNVWKANYQELINVGLKKKIVNDFADFRKEFNFKKYFDQLKRKKIDVITINDPNYPDNLKELPDAPLVIYVRGKIKRSDINSVAIVGSRKMTTYGKEVTTKLGNELSRVGLTIVSGLAFGVDLTAHKAALDAGGRCIAVLASGVDIITPRSNEWLGLKIIRSGGAIISEFPPGTDAQKHFFPFRNRIISGLSKAVIVVEGMIKSGTIHTAKHAAEQGKTVFAVPGTITSPMSQAPHYLIQNGAKMVTDTKDILEELNLQLNVDSEAVEKIMPSDKAEEKLINIIEKEEIHIDEIVRVSKFPMSEVSSKLTIMELKGMIKSLGDGVYMKT